MPSGLHGIVSVDSGPGIGVLGRTGPSLEFDASAQMDSDLWRHDGCIFISSGFLQTNKRAVHYSVCNVSNAQSKQLLLVS